MKMNLMEHGQIFDNHAMAFSSVKRWKKTCSFFKFQILWLLHTKKIKQFISVLTAKKSYGFEMLKLRIQIAQQGLFVLLVAIAVEDLEDCCPELQVELEGDLANDLLLQSLG